MVTLKIALHRYGSYQPVLHIIYQTSLERHSIFDDSIKIRKIEDRHVNTDNDLDNTELVGDNILLEADLQSYYGQLNTDGSDSITKRCDQEIKKATENPKQIENMITKTQRNPSNNSQL